MADEPAERPRGATARRAREEATGEDAATAPADASEPTAGAGDLFSEAPVAGSGGAALYRAALGLSPAAPADGEAGTPVADTPTPTDGADRARAAGARRPGRGSASAEPSEPTGAAAGEKAADPAADERRGHRDRLKRRFLEKGPEALADYEFLELVLFRTMPRRDTKPLAKRLLARFGGFWDVISAPEAELREVSGVGDAIVLDFRLYLAAIERAARERVREREVLSSWEEVRAYCRIAMAHETREQFRILLLDKKNRLIDDVVQQEGTVDHTPVYIREIMALALKKSATALILVHNHPSGDPSPSRADVEMTRRIVEVAEPLGIRIHDHLIIGRDGTASLRNLGHM